MRAYLILAALAAAACGGADAPATAPEPAVQHQADEAPAPAWPFAAWDRAVAYQFNQVPYGPGIPLHAWTPDDGLHPDVAAQPGTLLSTEQAARVIEHTAATRGEVEVSKCPFPRHGVVFFAGEAPVASVNVCFQCGDILVVPAFDDEPAGERAYDAKLAAYDAVFPQWEAFFGGELGMSLTPPERPQ